MGINNSLLKSIQTIVDKAINVAPFDKTRLVQVLTNNGDGTYTIRMDGVLYNNVPTYPRCLNIMPNTMCRLVMPSNQASQMFLYSSDITVETAEGDKEALQDVLDNKVDMTMPMLNMDVSNIDPITGHAQSGEDKDLYNALVNLGWVDSVITNMKMSVKKLLTDILGVDFRYPVGSYYETSDVSFDPNVTWGGTWELEIEGQVHVSAGTNYAVSGAETNTSDGGSPYIQAHTHNFTRPSVSNGGDHSHYFHYKGCGNGSNNVLAVWDTGAGGNYGSGGSHSHSLTGGSVGAVSGATTGSSGNMPPYINVYRWHRIA